MNRVSRTTLLVVVRFIQESTLPGMSILMGRLWGQARNLSQQVRVRTCRSREEKTHFVGSGEALLCNFFFFDCSEHRDHNSPLKYGWDTLQSEIFTVPFYAIVLYYPALKPRGWQKHILAMQGVHKQNSASPVVSLHLTEQSSLLVSGKPVFSFYY